MNYFCEILDNINELPFTHQKKLGLELKMTLEGLLHIALKPSHAHTTAKPLPLVVATTHMRPCLLLL